jgi:outer membrane lipoprotein carrier protein
MKTLLGLVLMGASVAVTAAQPAAPASAAALAQLIQSHNKEVTDFTADFTHAYKGGLLPQTSVEYGKVKIKKPGRMRWSYTKPEVKEIVADGKLLYTYIKADRVCYVSDLPTGDQAPTALLFLTGRGDLMRDFKLALSPTQSAAEWRLRLTPLKKEADFTELTIGVEPKSLRMITLESLDADGGKSTFTFANLRENTAIADKEFVFTPPKGCDVIR